MPPVGKTGEIDSDNGRKVLYNRVACAKLCSFLEKREAGSVSAEQNIYGSAIALPQIARSLGWPSMVTRSVIRGYFFLLLNVVVQAGLLYYVSKEDQTVAKFGGQMHLCDFGANMAACPDGDGCTGPAGSRYTPSRLYSYDAFVDRTFTRDSLLAVFPDLSDQIAEHVDPGEYGLESYGCRLLCVFLFMVAMISEFWNCWDMIALLWSVPSSDETWVTYEVPRWEAKERMKAMRGWSELDFIHIRVAGMPRFWKILNIFVAVLPKLFLWKICCEIGVFFLMETSAMDDLIVNSVALGFILELDELFFVTLTKDSVRYMMENLRPFQLFDTSADECYTEEEVLSHLEQYENLGWTFRDAMGFMPVRLIIALAWTTFFVWSYYHTNCQRAEDGTWVSVPMYLPRHWNLSILHVFLPRFFAGDYEDEPFWVPPHER